VARLAMTGLIREVEEDDKTGCAVHRGHIQYLKSFLEYDPAEELEREDGMPYS